MKFLNRSDYEKLSVSEKFADVCRELYGSNCDIDAMADRYLSLYNAHAAKYDGNTLVFSSPGRIEVCGNHTDHNNGKVLCASISVDTLAIVTPINERVITVASEGYPPVTVNIDNIMARPEEFGTSEALVRGVCAYYVNKGYKTGGFYATTTSNVFKGAGVSSSASFEVLICEILNVLYNGGNIDAVTKAKASHHAESVFFGKPCGLMDQSAIALGGVSFIDFENTEEPVIEKIAWGFDMDILLCNCGGDHCNLTDEYASIRTDMEAVAVAMGVSKLRFVTKNKFTRNLPKLQKRFTGKQLLRAMHYFRENERVVSAVKAIKAANASKFKQCINESGSSSYKLLQNCYVNTDTAQRIPLALAVINDVSASIACRVHGGGFAGTVIAFGSGSAMANCKKQLVPIFGENNVHMIKIRNHGTCQVEL